jgi:hypothetical protein
MEKISWIGHVRNEVLFIVKEQRNILHETSKRKAKLDWSLLRRNCLLQQVIEGNMKGVTEVTRIRRRRRRTLLDNVNEKTGYCHMKDEALDCVGRVAHSV